MNSAIPMRQRGFLPLVVWRYFTRLARYSRFTIKFFLFFFIFFLFFMMHLVAEFRSRWSRQCEYTKLNQLNCSKNALNGLLYCLCIVLQTIVEIPETVCALPLGMENEKIPDSAIVASSRYSNSRDKYGPERGRLNHQGKCFFFSKYHRLCDEANETWLKFKSIGLEIL